MKSKSLIVAIKVAAFCVLMAGAVVAAILPAPSGSSLPSQVDDSGSTAQNYWQREPPSLQFFFPIPTQIIGSAAPPQNSFGSGDGEYEGGLVTSSVGNGSSASGSSQQPPPSDWNNQVYDPTKPETIDTRFRPEKFCGNALSMLEARVINGWGVGYFVELVLTDAQHRVVYRQEGYNYTGRSVPFVFQPGQFQPGTYTATASARRKEHGKGNIPMSVTKSLEVIACEPGSSAVRLSSETFSISALDGEVVINARDGRRKIRNADVYITTKEGTVKRSAMFIDKLVLQVGKGVPYSISAVIYNSSVKELLAANFKGL